MKEDRLSNKQLSTESKTIKNVAVERKQHFLSHENVVHLRTGNIRHLSLKQSQYFPCLDFCQLCRVAEVDFDPNKVA